MKFEELTLDILLNVCPAQPYVEEVDYSKCPDIMNAIKPPEQQSYLQNLIIVTKTLHIYSYTFTYIHINLVSICDSHNNMVKFMA